MKEADDGGRNFWSKFFIGNSSSKVKRRKWLIRRKETLFWAVLFACLLDLAKTSDHTGFSYSQIYTANNLQITDGKENEGFENDKQRMRRLSGESSVMSFYRPTKQVFATALEDTNPLALEGKQKRHENDVKISFEADNSDQVTVVPLEIISFSEESIGGINHVAGFSKLEEKVLDYYDVTASSSSDKLVGDNSSEEDGAEILFEKSSDATPTDDDLFTDGPFEVDDVEGDKGGHRTKKLYNPRIDIVSKLLRIVETQALQGANCQPGTALKLGDRVVNRYAEERFQDAAIVAVNRANWLTRMWKYAPNVIGNSEYLLHTSILSMLEINEDIFAAGNCYDAQQYKDYFLFCPFAYRLPEGPLLAKDLAIEYNYLSNTSEWFLIARKKGEQVIKGGKSFKTSYHMYQYNSTHHTGKETDLILTVSYEDGAWTKPYYDCGGGNIWMMTYTVPFFGFQDGKYIFKGTSGIDIDLRRVDINQCASSSEDDGVFNIFGGTDKCKTESTTCQPVSGLGFRRGSYKCVCQKGFYFPDTTSIHKFFNGTDLEEEYAKILEGEESIYELDEAFQCLECAPGCESCLDGSACIVTLNWVLRTILLILQCIIIFCLPIVVLFTYKYSEIKVVRAASPVLLRIIILGAFFIYSTTIVLYPTPNIVTCTMRIWLREIGFALAYGALMLKTWRISVIFRVRSAKAVKITDMDLIKRLGIIVGTFVLFLLIRTLVSPPIVIVGRTAEELKAFLCQSDWWDHSFTILEFLFLLWGIRLCIMVRKAPSEFNESRFISMAIYNEFLLSIFLNVSMFFLQHPANPDLLYIIFFCHSQLTITILLCLIFASKFYLVMKGHGKNEETSLTSKNGPGKFIAAKVRAAHTSLSQQSNVQNTGMAAASDGSKLTEKDVQLELDRIFQTLQLLKDRNNPISTNAQVALKIAAIQEAFKQAGTLATAAAAATATSTAPTQCDTISTKSEQCIVATEDTSESADSSKKTTPRKMSSTPRALSIGDSQAAALALAGAAVSHAAAAFLQNPCQNSVERLSPNSHDSPVIVHATDRGSQRVSFDLNGTDRCVKDDAIEEQCDVFIKLEDGKTEAGVMTASREARGSSGSFSGSSSCRSSRCCCSSYACSCCSPRGSLACEEEEEEEEEGDESEVECNHKQSNHIASVLACEPCSIETLRYQCVPLPRENEVEKESKFIQTDPTTTSLHHQHHHHPQLQQQVQEQHQHQQEPSEAFNHVTNNSCGTSPNSESTETGLSSAQPETQDSSEICIAAPLQYSNHVQSSETLCKSFPSTNHNKTRSTNNRHDTRSGHARTHKIVINLDDKERFTEEVIV